MAPQSTNRYSYALNDPVNLADPTGLTPNLYDPFAWMTDASIHGPGLYIDGSQILQGQESLFWGLLSMGAGVIANIGSTAYLGKGGATFVTVQNYKYTYQRGSDVIRIGVTLYETTYQVQDDLQIFFLPNDGTLYSPEKWNQRIVEIIRGFVRNSECVNAYKLVGIDLPGLLKKGITIGPADALKKLSAAALGLMVAAQTGMRNAFFQERGLFQAEPLAISTIGSAGTTSGRPHIFLGGDAFTSLKEVLAHELIHSGGYQKKGSGANDLSYMGIGYDNIINTCAK